MTIIDLSDIGKSLLAIDQEIQSNKSQIDYYNKMISEYCEKNTALQDTAETLMANYRNKIQGVYKV
jgi:transcription elongation factor Elf1